MKATILMIHQAVQPIAWYTVGGKVFLGSLYIALLSQVEIPLQPVPMTLQTFAIFSLALFQGSRCSFFSLLLYLFEATLGLPVFPGADVDPFWILHPSAGYCLSFPLAAYIAGRFAELRNPPSVIVMILGLCCAQLFIYLVGVSWLSFSLGWQQALAVGLYPFIPFSIVKLFAALSAKMAARPIVHLLKNGKR